MVRIAIIIGPHTSFRNASFHLAHCLMQAGHDVIIASDTDFTDEAQRDALSFVRLSVEPDAQTASTVGGEGMVTKALKYPQRILSYQQRRESAVAVKVEKQVRLDTFVDTHQPDVMLVDVEEHDYIIAAWASGFQFAMLSNLIGIHSVPEVPPTHTAIIPGQGVDGRSAVIDRAWVKYRAWKWLWFARDWLLNAGLGQMQQLRAFADEVGFPQDEFLPYHWLLPTTYRTIPVLTMFAQEFDFPHEPYPSVTYSGPMLNVSNRRVDQPASEELAALLEKHTMGSEDRTLVYCTFGTFIRQNDVAFLARLIEAFRELPDVDVIFGMGRRHNVDDIHRALGAKPPENVYIHDWVPQLRVLELADCAIIHGGTSTVNECIHFEVPMLLYPLGLDQPGNAARVVYHGMGIMGNRSSDIPAQIRGHVESLLSDDTYRRALKRMNESIASAGCSPAVEFIEQLSSNEDARKKHI
ncbi:MAG: nucleotide disphospho-sugar-binding domain-containing protein [Chloroflexota bacterium]